MVQKLKGLVLYLIFTLSLFYSSLLHSLSPLFLFASFFSFSPNEINFLFGQESQNFVLEERMNKLLHQLFKKGKIFVGV